MTSKKTKLNQSDEVDAVKSQVVHKKTNQPNAKATGKKVNPQQTEPSSDHKSKLVTPHDYLVIYNLATTIEEKHAVALDWKAAEPNSLPAWFFYGESLQAIGDSESAIAAYTTARNLSAGDIPTLGRLAELHFNRGEFAESFSFYEEILGHDAPPAWAMVGIGNVCEMLGDTESTLDYFLIAINLDDQYLSTLGTRSLAIFEALPTLSKNRFVQNIQVLLDQMRGASPKKRKVLQISRVQRLCSTLLSAHQSFNETSDTHALKGKTEPPSLQAEKSSLAGLLLRVSINIEGIRHGRLKVRITGWPGKTLNAALFVDGEKTEQVQFLPSPSDDYADNDLHASQDVSTKYLDAQPHVYFLQFEAGTHFHRSEPVVLRYPEYKVHLDSWSYQGLSGWAYNASTNNRIELTATNAIGGALEVTSGMPRADVASQHAGAPQQTGFTVRLQTAWPQCSHLIQLCDSETDIVLSQVSIASRYSTLLDISRQWAGADQTTHHANLAAVASRLVNETSNDLMVSSRFLPTANRGVDLTEVAVIIPVYKGLEETIECIESVLAAENQTRSKIIIINDNSPDPQIVDYLHALERHRQPNLLILHRQHNGGFSEAVNIGIIIGGDRDVILLNSDTVVQSGWLDRLAHAARSDSRIGTVTPLSNNAEICTVPYTCKSLPIDKPELAVEIDQTAARVNAGCLVDIPVAIGFCMYIKRSCIDAIGLFDAATWGRGYGEEVDFCLKAAAMGWRHVMAGDTFIVHRGNVSFGDEKLKRIEESAKKISERYPFYDALIHRYISTDPSVGIRRNINLALIAETLPPKRFLHVSHSYGGGTEQYIKDQNTFNIEGGYTPIVLRFDDSGDAEMTLKLKGTRLDGFFTAIHKETWRREEIELLKKDLVRLGFERLHLHAPFGMPMAFLEWLVGTYPTTMTIHDYAWICPRVTLTQAGARYCQEPPAEQCNRCLKFNPPHAGLRHFLDAEGGDVARYRQAFARILAKAEIIYAGTQDVVNRMERHGMHAKYKAMPHPHPEGSVFLKQVKIPQGSVKDGIIRVAMIGGISEIKGFYTLLECAVEAKLKRLPIEFIVFGKTADDSQFAELNNVRITGPYKEEELEDFMLTYRPNVAFFPNQGPETYSYTLSHALRFGLLPVVTDIGAPAERLLGIECSARLPLLSSTLEVIHALTKAYQSQH